MMNKPIYQILISIVLVIALLGGAYFIVAYQRTPPKTPVDNNLNPNLEIVSTDARTTAIKLIEINGTMGNVERDITQESMESNEATYANGTRRLKSLNKIKNAVVPGNKLIIGNESDNIENFVNNLDYPFLYETSNVVASEPSKPEKLMVFSDSGNVEYDSVKVLVDFESTRIHYTCPKDVTYAGIHKQISNIESFENIEVVLVKVEDLWFVYDITDSEKIVNERFATWSGAGVSIIDYEKNKETGEFVIEGFEPPYIPTEESNLESDTNIDSEDNSSELEEDKNE